MKVVAIGFNRCGTQSLHQFFVINGYSALHSEEGRIEAIVKNNHLNGELLCKGLEKYTFISDIDFLSRHFTLLAEQYPDMKFIYNYRNMHNWIKSRIKLFTKLGLPIQEAFWKAEWIAHRKMVREYFVGERKKRLLEFNIEEDRGKSIAKFLPELNFSNLKFTKVDWL